jgi:colanic acid biosynthesis glycosyl transferase WcaI
MKTILIFSQVYVPDPAAVGQYMADAAAALAQRGYRVVVYTSGRGYDDPSQSYPRRETIDEVDVRRLPFASFGKKSILTRLIGTASFAMQALLRGLFTPNTDAILFSTSPPMIGLVATIIRSFRGIPTVYWAMDLNPDQLLALGKIKADGVRARLLESINRMILHNASLVVALDRFMADRLASRHERQLRGKIAVIPPWPHERVIESMPHEQNPFRRSHGLNDKFVIMYSGNHSPSNPLDTLLEAALRLRHRVDVRFLFVGGGIGKKAVEQFIRDHDLSNCMSLPYQPMCELRYSLSAADVHVVSLGQEMVGIIHPCKVYGAMAVARPILFLGPRPSHIADLLDNNPIGFHVAHGDIDGAVTAIESLAAKPRSELQQMGHAAQAVLQRRLSQSQLVEQFCSRIERLLAPPR